MGILRMRTPQVRTRFAPSPTGELHIGGVRTAIFNWAYARRHGGEFYLRIDDTDRERYVEGTIDRILDGLRWLALDWSPCDVEQGRAGHIYPATQPNWRMSFAGDVSETEPGVLYQSLRSFRYMEIYHQLLGSGLGYLCYCTKEEIEKEKQESQDRKDPIYKYSGRCRERKDQPFMEPCLRLNIQAIEEKEVVFQDEILGSMNRSTEEIGDPVLFRPGGQAVYHLATVVDDADCAITHVIRGQDHLTNTFLQILIYQALGLPIPKFAHIPLVCAPGKKKKFSKRDAEKLGVPTLDAYREMGYIPEALFNYLSHLGWALDDKTEKWSQQEFVQHFDLKGVVKTPASFDPQKLLWLQTEYMKEKSTDEKADSLSSYLKGKIPSIKHLRKVIDAVGDRLHLPSDLNHYLHFFDDDKFKIEDDILQERVVKPNILEHLIEFNRRLNEVSEWTDEHLENICRQYCEETGISAPLLIHAIRVGSTGNMIGFGVFLGLEILGKKRTLDRLTQAIQKAQAHSALHTQP